MKTWHEQHAVHAFEDVEEELVGELEADVHAPITRFFHSGQVLLRNDHTRQLVVAELGVLVALEWHDLHHGRDGWSRYPNEESVELLQVVQRLANREVHASLHLLILPIQL